MGSLYPAGLDSFPTNKVAGQIHLASLQNDVDDAVNLIEAELGTSPSGTEATVADRLDAIEAATGSSLGIFSVTDYGALGDGVADDTAEIQAAIDACETAGGGIINVPPGTYKCSDTITLPIDVPVRFVGAGPASILTWQGNELGTGTYALDWTGIENASRHYIGQMRFIGPSTTTTIGSQPADMDGILLKSNVTLDALTVSGFRAGIDSVGNHSRIYNTTSGSNYYNLYLGPGPDTFGDLQVTDTVLTGPTLASLAIHGENGIQGGIFRGTHFGFGPYGIYKQTVSTQDVITLGTIFQQCSFENVGNAVLEDQALTGKVYGTYFTDCSTSYSASYRYASLPYDYFFHVGGIEGLFIDSHGRDQSFMSVKGNVGFFYIDDTFTGVRWKGADAALLAAISAAVPLFKVASGASIDLSNYISTYAYGGASPGLYQLRRINSAASAVTKGHLLQNYGSQDAQTFSGASAIPIGWAAQNTSVGEFVPVQVAGEVIGKTTIAVGGNKFVKPDTSNAGKVAESSGWSDGPILGHAPAGAGASADILVHARLGIGLTP